MINLGNKTDPDYRECLAACVLRQDDFNALVRTLFQATADEANAHSMERPIAVVCRYGSHS